MITEVGEQSREYHCSGMRRHHRQHIVKIQRVAERAVDQRGHFRAALHCSADDRAAAGFAAEFEIGQQRRGDFAFGTLQHGSDCVGDDLAGFFKGVRGEVGAGAAVYEFGYR